MNSRKPALENILFSAELLGESLPSQLTGPSADSSRAQLEKRIQCPSLFRIAAEPFAQTHAVLHRARLQLSTRLKGRRTLNILLEGLSSSHLGQVLCTPYTTVERARWNPSRP